MVAGVAWLVAMLLVTTAVLLAYALRRSRAPAGNAFSGSRTWGPPSWEMLWIAVPLLVLALIFVLSLRR